MSRPQIAFQGEPGAWSEVALRMAHGPDADAVPLPHFGDVFASLARGKIDGAVLPVENTTTGSVFQVVDLLFDSEVCVVGEVVVPIRHVLLARPGVALPSIRRVLSHPQALDQCAAFLHQHRMRPVPTFDTAGAAAMLATQGADAAALASPLAGELHGLVALTHDVSHASNMTRFVVVAPSARLVDGADKTSLGITAAHEPGSLLRCLQAFADHGVNMTKLESRPVPGQPWHYRFWVDVDGAATSPHVAAALKQMQDHAERIRVFGSYIGAKEVTPDDAHGA